MLKACKLNQRVTDEGNSCQQEALQMTLPDFGHRNRFLRSLNKQFMGGTNVE